MSGILRLGVSRAMKIVLCAIAITCFTTRASALTFVFTQDTDSGVSAMSAADQAAFQTAANAWSTYLTDNITVNIRLGSQAMTGNQSNTLASTSASLVGYSGTTIRNALTADKTSVDDNTAITSLANIGSGTVAVTSANARAMGLTGASANPASDGTILLNSDFAYSTSRNADGTIAANTYDLVGIAEHEIGHALGFLSYIDTYDYNVAHSTNPSSVADYPSVLDLFRYTASGQRTQANGNAYFSIDNGQTQIASFADGVSDQASHWTQGTNGVMAPEAAPGQTENITGTDLRAMDVIGYNLASVPEPATWSMMILGFGAIGTAMRRRGAGPLFA